MLRAICEAVLNSSQYLNWVVRDLSEAAGQDRGVRYHITKAASLAGLIHFATLHTLPVRNGVVP
jgi:hypothetical protein